jgi:uncharacterized protein YccT (UPF0319 family)
MIESDVKVKLMLLHAAMKNRQELAKGLIERRVGLEEQLAAVDSAIAEICSAKDAQIAELTNEIQELTLRYEGTIKTEHGKATFTSGYARVTFNAKALDAAITSNPNLNWLKLHRQESQVKPRVKVEIYSA